MTNAVANLSKTPLVQVNSVKKLLMNQGARDQLAMVAARHLNPERMMRVTANAIRANPKLGQCEPMSFLGALMQCASLGLEPNTVMGHAYLIPFENRRKNITEVQVVVGYKGLIDLARRSGHITSISAGIHYDDDELWEYEEGTEARLRHRMGPQEGKKRHAYAIAKFRDGGHAYVVLPWSKIISIRDASQGYKTAIRYNKTDTPWITHEDEMAKKTAIRALSKYLPMSIEFVEALTTDEAKADYRAFAMDPMEGLNLSAEDGVIDGEISDAEPAADQGRALQDERAAQAPLPDQGQQRQADPQEARKEPQQRTAEPRQQRQQGDPRHAYQDNQNDTPAVNYQAIVDRIAGNLLDGMSPEKVVSDFANEIAAIKAHAPSVFENLQSEIEQYAPDLVDKI